MFKSRERKTSPRTQEIKMQDFTHELSYRLPNETWAHILSLLPLKGL